MKITKTRLPLNADAAPPVTGLVMGTLAALDRQGGALVSFEGNPAGVPVPARALVQLNQADIGKMIALQFERGDIAQAVVIGLLHSRAGQAGNTASDNVTIAAKKNLTLKCGKASISLDADGNVEIRGQDLLFRAAGENSIKGSSVSLN